MTVTQYRPCVSKVWSPLLKAAENPYWGWLYIIGKHIYIRAWVHADAQDVCCTCGDDSVKGEDWQMCSSLPTSVWSQFVTSTCQDTNRGKKDEKINGILTKFKNKTLNKGEGDTRNDAVVRRCKAASDASCALGCASKRAPSQREEACEDVRDPSFTPVRLISRLLTTQNAPPPSCAVWMVETNQISCVKSFLRRVGVWTPRQAGGKQLWQAELHVSGWGGCERWQSGHRGPRSQHQSGCCSPKGREKVHACILHKPPRLHQTILLCCFTVLRLLLSFLL